MSASAVMLENSSVRRQPFGGAYLSLLLFMLIYCARPEDWIPGVGHLPLAKIIGFVVIVAGIVSVGQSRRRLPRETLYLLAFTACLWFSVPFSPVWRGGAFWGAFEFTKLVPVIFVMILAVTTVERLRRLILVQTASVAVISCVTIWKARTLHGRLTGVLSGNYSNANDLAIQIVVCLPFCLVFLLQARKPLIKAAWGLAILCMSYGVFLTGSRGGFLAWAVVMAICAWQFGIRGRRRWLIVLSFVGALLMGVVGGGIVASRFAAITDAKTDASAYASAQDRKKLFLLAFEETAEHPLFGIGVENFPVISGMWLEDHDIFTQISAEVGIPALILFLMIVVRGFRNVREVKRVETLRSERMIWAQGLYASLVGLVVTTTFAPDAYQYFVYILLSYPSALLLITREDRRILENKKQEGKPGRSIEERNEQRFESELQWSSF